MILKAVGLAPHGRLSRMLARLSWRAMRWRVGSLVKKAA
jgi:hypothetical protein